MERQEIKIMLVEDDTELKNLLAETLKGEGFQVQAYAMPKDALTNIPLFAPDLLITDCMLPQMSGVDLAMAAQAQEMDLKTILISGIYTDKTFIKDALLKTKAIGFITKPFDNKVLVDKILEAFGEEIEAPPDLLDALMVNKNMSSNEIIEGLKQKNIIHSFHLPLLLLKLMQTKATCELSLILDNQVLGSISVSDSSLVAVQAKDPKSYFGNLLVEKDLLTHEELEAALQVPSKKRIGEKLIDANLISPHMIPKINAEQMALRLSRLIADTEYEIRLDTERNSNSGSKVEINLFHNYLNDWLQSKIHFHWLQKNYVPWADKALVLGPHFSIKDPIFMLSLAITCREVWPHLQNGISIEQILQNTNIDEVQLLPFIHLLLTTGNLYFDRENSQQSNAVKLQRLKKLDAQMSKQDHFQILGVSRKTRANDIKKAFHDLARHFHPDRLDASASVDLQQITEKIFSRMTKAYDTLINDTEKQKVKRPRKIYRTHGAKKKYEIYDF